MVRSAIKANPKEKRKPEDNSPILHISELVYDTIQGEGITTGQPAVFLRTQGCQINCFFCDSKEVWRKGNPYSVEELLHIFRKEGLMNKLMNNSYLVVTGGSPLLQQTALVELFRRMRQRFNYLPKIEIENECVLLPNKSMIYFVHQWNNSPKLSNSGVKKELRYKPEIIQYTADQPNSFFKFVVKEEKDWNEIEKDFLKPKLIRKSQIILMPEGGTRKELYKRYKTIVNIACREGVRMTDRLHIQIWNKATGV